MIPPGCVWAIVAFLVVFAAGELLRRVLSQAATIGRLRRQNSALLQGRREAAAGAYHSVETTIEIADLMERVSDELAARVPKRIRATDYETAGSDLASWLIGSFNGSGYTDPRNWLTTAGRTAAAEWLHDFDRQRFS